MGKAQAPYANRGPIEATSISTALSFSPPMPWIHVVSAGSGGMVVLSEDGASHTLTGLASGDILLGPFAGISSMTCSKIRYGDGTPPQSTALSPVAAPQAASLGPFAAISVVNQATLSGLAQTVDGVALSTAGMRVYLAKQTIGAQNGAWLAQAGNWTRPSDWASGASIPLGTQIQIAPGGAANFQKYGSLWYVDSGAVVDTDTIIAYPVEQKGQATLTSASPSTVTVSGLWVKSTTTTRALATNVTTPADGIGTTLTTGAGTGTLVLTGPNTVTDVVAWGVRNG